MVCVLWAARSGRVNLTPKMAQAQLPISHKLGWSGGVAKSWTSLSRMSKKSKPRWYKTLPLWCQCFMFLCFEFGVWVPVKQNESKEEIEQRTPMIVWSFKTGFIHVLIIDSSVVFILRVFLIFVDALGSFPEDDGYPHSYLHWRFWRTR